ncbi:hypothetical protein Plhal304r1_c021g0074141 [Plasmopara halstedii]
MTKPFPKLKALAALRQPAALRVLFRQLEVCGHLTVKRKTMYCSLELSWIWSKGPCFTACESVTPFCPTHVAITYLNRPSRSLRWCGAPARL